MARINVNSATMAQLMEVPYVGQSSAREIIKLREEHDGFLTKDDFVSLKCYRKNPIIMESFEFGAKSDSMPSLISPETLEKQLSLAEGARSKDSEDPIDNDQEDFDVNNTELIQLLEDERKRGHEAMQNLHRQRLQDQAQFRGEIEELKKLFLQQRNEDQERYDALKRKTDGDRSKLEWEIQTLKTRKETEDATSDPGELAVSYDDKIKQKQKELHELEQEKMRRVTTLERSGAKTKIDGVAGVLGAVGGKPPVTSHMLPQQPMVHEMKFKEPPAHQRFPA